MFLREGFIMDRKNIYFDNAIGCIRQFFQTEFPNLPENDLQNIFNMFYSLSNYEEEGLKVRPSLFLTNNINYLIKNVPNCYKLTIYSDKDSSNFQQRLKNLMCFCKNEWSIFINYGESGVDYGLVRALNSMKDKTLTSLVFEDYRELLQNKIFLTNIAAISGGLVNLSGIRNSKIGVCFNLNHSIIYNSDKIINDFVNAIVSKLKTSARKLRDIKNIYYNIFYKVLKDLHGTICLIIDKDFVDTKGLLADGTWLKEPIEFGKLFLQSKNYNEFKLSSYADLLFTMLNYDGITVIDNTGRIRAYNVFIETNQKLSSVVLGGARKRAAHTLLNYKNKKIIGVYFQSQDGENFYQESFHSRKNKKLIIDDNLLPLERLAKQKKDGEQTS